MEKTGCSLWKMQDDLADELSKANDRCPQGSHPEVPPERVEGLVEG
jgi:hypothetical protein